MKNSLNTSNIALSKDISAWDYLLLYESTNPAKTELVKGIKLCLIERFDLLSIQVSDEYNDLVHYYLSTT